MRDGAEAQCLDPGAKTCLPYYLLLTSSKAACHRNKLRRPRSRRTLQML